MEEDETAVLEEGLAGLSGLVGLAGESGDDTPGCMVAMCLRRLLRFVEEYPHRWHETAVLVEGLAGLEGLVGLAGLRGLVGVSGYDTPGCTMVMCLRRFLWRVEEYPHRWHILGCPLPLPLPLPLPQLLTLLASESESEDQRDGDDGGGGGDRLCTRRTCRFKLDLLANVALQCSHLMQAAVRGDIIALSVSITQHGCTL